MARARSMAECSPEANRGYREGSRGPRQEAQCDGLQGGVGSRSTIGGGSESNRGSSQGRGERGRAGCRVCSRLAKAGPGGTLVCTDGAVESWRLAVGVSLIVRAQPPTLFLGGQVLGVPASETRRRHKRCKSAGPATTVASPGPTFQLGRAEGNKKTAREDQKKKSDDRSN